MTVAPATAPAGQRPGWRFGARDLAALALFAALAAAHTWPLASAPASLSRHDNGDALLNEWTVAWVVHQLPRDPAHLFDANIFYPEANTLAFSEHLFTQSVMAAPLVALGLTTTAVHNVLLLIGLALTGWTTYLVVAYWTGDRPAGVLAGCLFAFNALTLTRLAHLQAMHLEFLPLAVLALWVLLDRPSVAAAFWLALAFAAQGLASNYLLVFTAVGLTAAAFVHPAVWHAGRWRRVAGPIALSAGVATAMVLPFLWPYYQAHADQGLARGLVEIRQYSASWRDYLATGGRLHYAFWSRALWEAGPTALFPGVTAMALAGVALAGGTAWRDVRARMWLAAGVAGVVLSFGPVVPGYVLLGRVFPLLQGIRAPVRFGLLGLAAVAVLAGFGLARLRAAWPRRGAVLAAASILLVTVEAWRAPIAYVPALRVPAAYAVLAGYPDAVVAEFPLPGPEGVFHNAPYMLYSTAHWKPMINGYSGFMPASYERHWEAVRRFPQPEAIAALARIGVTHVVVHDDEDLIVHADLSPALSRLAAEGTTVIYRLDARTALAGGGRP